MSQRGKSVFVCLMLVAASVWFQAWRGKTTQHPIAPAAQAANPAAALQGEAAIQQLKTDGGYASLAAAMTAARYQINTAFIQPGQSAAPYYADNPGQQLRASFAPDEVRVNAASNQASDTAGGKTEGAELRLQLAGFGYGDQLEPLAAGKLTAHGDRITIRKSAIHNPQSAIEEWYVNKPEGLEQGFTLAAPPQSAIRNPQSAIPLRVVLSVGDGWRVSLHGDQQGAVFERKSDGLRLGYDHLAAVDAQGRTLPARMALDGGTLALLVEDAHAAYPLTIDPLITQQRKLTAADGEALDQFGHSVALSGNTAVIGAPSDDIGANTNQGSVHVFVRNGNSWSPQQKLTANGGAALERFGVTLALSGDTLAVSAPSANTSRGAVYLFTRSGTTWTQQTRLTAHDAAEFDFFGISLALSSDTLAVGAHFADIGGRVDQGAAYVFARDGAVWSPQRKLMADDGAAFDQFGGAVALSGETVVVGAEGIDTGGNENQGGAYVFTRSGGAWTQQQKLTANDGTANDNFGRAVALSGDTAVVSAPFDAIGANENQGAVYVFTRGGTTWTPQLPKLTAGNGAAGDVFGSSVALSGDTLVAGAGGDDLGAANQGSAYVFARSGATWNQQRHLFAEDGAANDGFGGAVALSGDTVLVGAPNETGVFTQQGAAYAFVIRANNHVQQQPLTANDGAAFDSFGGSVAISGDTVVVGAPSDVIGTNVNQGSAYVFTRSGMVWTLQQKLTAGDGAANDFFGQSVAVSGDTVVIGAAGDNIGAKEDQGSAYVFTRSGTTWTLQVRLTANDGVAFDQFGFSVAVSGDTVVVGAQADDIGANGNQGSAYVFVRSGTFWTQQQKLTANDGAANDLFGWSVALSGDTVAVGAPQDTIGTNVNQGSAYVFTRSGTTWTPQQKLTANDGATFDDFGFSVALSGDTVAVGALNDNIGANPDQGSAYVFTRSGTVWTPQQKLTANDGAGADQFGVSVALSGDTVVVGAINDAIGANANQGSAYVFTRIVTTWTQQQRLTANDGAALDKFGRSVALSGDTVAVGANSKTIGGKLGQGAAYVFVSPACPTITLNPASLPGAQLSVPYSQTVTASVSGGGAGPVQFSLSDGALPPGLTLSPNGQLSGTPTTAGTYHFTITATKLDSLCPGSRSYTLTVTGASCPTVTINPATLPAGQGGAAYSQQLSASGGAAPYSFAVTAGALPNGMSLSAAGLLSGAPTAFGAFNFTVRATDANGCTGARAYTLTITAPCPALTVNPSSLPAGRVGAVYNRTITASGGAAPYTMSVSAGGLPAGLNLSQAGVLSGAPAGAGSFNFTIRATDANGCQGTRSYTLTVNGGGGAVTGLQYYPLPRPVRLLDTRPGETACNAPGVPLADEGTFNLAARGNCDGVTIPATARAVVGNATVVNSISGGGFITLFPSDAVQPNASNLNFTANHITPNSFTVGLGNDGAFKISSSAATHFIVDITGYYAPPGAGGLYYHQLTGPVRLLDTRPDPGFPSCVASSAPLTGGASLTVPVVGACGGATIPASAKAVMGNATVVNFQSGGGFITLYPEGAPPNASNLNFTASHIVPNSFVAGLGAGGAFNIFASAGTDFIVDVAGYFSDQAVDENGEGLLFYPLTAPARWLDTRPDPAFPSCIASSTPLANDGTFVLQAVLACEGQTIPAAAKSVLGNATVVNFVSGGGFITLYPFSAAQPNASNLNYKANHVVPNSFVVGLSSDGKFNIFSSVSSHFIVDLTGYFAP